jgi:hypothetical protein
MKLRKVTFTKAAVAVAAVEVMVRAAGAKIKAEQSSLTTLVLTQN